jgi:uncharacterized membrane protein
MHTIVRYYIRTAFVFLLLGLLLGAYFLVETYWMKGGYPAIWVTAHVHILLVGFVMFMILGVAQWMFPRPSRNDQHYSPAMAYFIYYFITFCTAVRFLAEILMRWIWEGWIHHVLVIASLGQVVAFFLFFYNMWTRIRPVGSHIREAKGERF